MNLDDTPENSRMSSNEPWLGIVTVFTWFAYCRRRRRHHLSDRDTLLETSFICWLSHIELQPSSAHLWHWVLHQTDQTVPANKSFLRLSPQAKSRSKEYGRTKNRKLFTQEISIFVGHQCATKRSGRDTGCRGDPRRSPAAGRARWPRETVHGGSGSEGAAPHWQQLAVRPANR